MAKKLLASNRNKMVLGVCGGVGEYFDIDANIVRILAVILAIGGVGMGVIIYLICYLLMNSNQR